MRYLSDLIEALRAELQQYGELLARFEDPAAHVGSGIPEEVLATVATIHDQQRVVAMRVRRRKQIQRRFARHVCLPERAELSEIVALLPRQYQLLIRALMEENRDLSMRVQQTADRKRAFLRRSLELMATGFGRPSRRRPTVARCPMKSCASAVLSLA
jgi:hypothetical protein